MPCSCGSSKCTCKSKCLCSEVRCVCISCFMSRNNRCQLCGLQFSHEDAVSPEGWCKCFLSEGLASSGSGDQSIFNRTRDDFNTSTSNDFQDKLPLATVSLESSYLSVESGSAHAQSRNTAYSGPFNVLDISDCRTTSNRAQHESNLPIISLEKKLLSEQNEPQKQTEFKSGNSSRIPENPSVRNFGLWGFESAGGSSSVNSQLHSRRERTENDLNSQFHSNRAGRTVGNLFNSKLYSNRGSKTAQAWSSQLHSNSLSRNSGASDLRSVTDASQKRNSQASTVKASNFSDVLPTDYTSNAQIRPPTRTAAATSTSNEWSSQRRRWCVVRTSQIRSPPLTYINPVLAPNMDSIRNWIDNQTNDSSSSSTSSEESTANLELISKSKYDQNVKSSKEHSAVVASCKSSPTGIETAVDQKAAHTASNTVNKSCKSTAVQDKDGKDTSANSPDNLSTSLKEKLNTGGKTADASSTSNSSSDELTSD